jgi:hypothetical protein
LETLDMTRSATLGLVLVTAAALGTTTACGGSGSSNTSAIPAPSGTVVTDTFTGTVALPVAGVLQVDSHNFTVTVAGGVSITLTAAGPPATITMGLGVGNPAADGTCSFLSGGTTQTPAGSTAQLSGTLAAGTYCVAVGDIGNALQPISYTVTVAHT